MQTFYQLVSGPVNGKTKFDENRKKIHSIQTEKTQSARWTFIQDESPQIKSEKTTYKKFLLYLYMRKPMTIVMHF